MKRCALDQGCKVLGVTLWFKQLDDDAPPALPAHVWEAIETVAQAVPEKLYFGAVAGHVGEDSVVPQAGEALQALYTSFQAAFIPLLQSETRMPESTT